MNRTTLVILALLCGLPGVCLCMSGSFVFLMGFLADEQQMYIDTGLSTSSIMIYGFLAGFVGLALVAVPLITWLQRRHKS